MTTNQEIKKFLDGALESSVFINPEDPGLSYDELLEAGKSAGYLEGELRDSAADFLTNPFGQSRILPPNARYSWWSFVPEDPEYRNFEAFDFVIQALNERVRQDGVEKAQLDRSALVARALEKDIPKHDIEVAITYQVLAGTLSEEKGIISFVAKEKGEHPLPSKQCNAPYNRQAHKKPFLERAYPIVKDIIERRTDGRPRSAEPLDAFAEELAKLGYGQFRLWWTQLVRELRCNDANSSPVSVLVIAAALVEGALTFVVKHARALNQPVFRSNDFEGDPKTWKLDKLVASAASGNDAAILDPPTKARAELLIRNRQRIHAGRMISDYPAGVPDTRPEEARDAKATAEQVVRCVLGWLQKFSQEKAIRKALEVPQQARPGSLGAPA